MTKEGIYLIASLVLFAVLMCFCWAWACICNKRFEETLPITIFALIALLYGLFILRAAALSVPIVLGLSVASAIFGTIVAVKRKTIVCAFHSMFTAAFVVYTLLCVISILISRGRYVTDWDEFSHWADIVWVMSKSNTFGAWADMNSLFPHYPPAMALWQYLLQKIAAAIIPGDVVVRESLLFISYQWLVFSLFMPFMRHFSLRRPFEMLGALLAIIASLITAGTAPLHRIYIDTAMACLAGYAFAMVAFADLNDRTNRLSLCLGLFVLTLMKDAAPVFAIGACVAVLFAGRDESARNKVLLFLKALCTTLFAKLSWSMIIWGCRSAENAGVGGIFKALFGILTGDSRYRWHRKIISKYLKQFFISDEELAAPMLGISLSVAAFLLLLAIGFCFLYRVGFDNEKSRKRFFNVTIVCICTGIAYFAGLLFVYLFSFTKMEVERLACFARYVKVFCMVALFLLATAAFSLVRTGRMGKLSRTYSAVFLVALLLLSPIGNVIDLVSGADAEQSFFWNYYALETAERLKDVAPENSEVYVIAQNDDGVEHLKLKYRARPLNVGMEAHCVYYGTMHTHSSDFQCEEISPEDFRERLRLNYDYLVLYALDDDFIDTFGCLFSSPDDIVSFGIYSIQHDTGKITLVSQPS